MPSEQSTQIVKHIIDDLRGTAYYADPIALGGFLKGRQGAEAGGKRRRSKSSGICFTNTHRAVRPIKTLRSCRSSRKFKFL